MFGLEPEAEQVLETLQQVQPLSVVVLLDLQHQSLAVAVRGKHRLNKTHTHNFISGQNNLFFKSHKKALITFSETAGMEISTRPLANGE